MFALHSSTLRFQSWCRVITSVRTVSLAGIAFLLASPALAQTAADSPETESILIEAEAESDQFVQGPFLPDVQSTRINKGKKTSIIDLDEFPQITNNNYRQALSK